MKILVAILIGVVLTVFFFLWGAFMSGGGHSLTAITVFFPYAGIVGTLPKDTRWQFVGDAASLFLGASQFPLYAILLALLKGTRRKSLALVVLLAVHAMAAVVALKL